MATLHADEPHHHLPESDNSVQLLLRVRQTLELCSELVGNGDIIKTEQELSKLVIFLNSISDAIVDGATRNHKDVEDELEDSVFQILTEFRRFITSSLDPAVIDALSFELPKLAARLGCASQRCLDIAVSVVDSFADLCNSRDMLPILCEALGSPSQMFMVPDYFIPLLTAFPKVFVSIKRRQFEQVKAAVPVILNALKTISMRSDDEDDAIDVVNLFHRMNCIADSVKTVCLNLRGEYGEQLRALLGLCVLQTLALLSIGMKYKLEDCLPLVLHLSYFFPYCGLTYAELITGTYVNNLLYIVLGDNKDDDCAGCFSHILLGASLAVIWGSKWNEVAMAAEADLATLKNELQSSQAKRWEAVGMLKHVFLCVNLPWELKQYAINFLLNIIDGNSLQHDHDADFSTFTPSLYTAMQAIQVVIMYAPDALIRKNAFAAFKKLLADLPSSLRFDILSALIKNSDSSSMIAVLVDCVREEMRTENSKRSESFGCSWFWNANVLELVELVLRPPGGGPPALPEHCDAVLSALNLYRFILITESTGKTNYTGVVCKEHLKKVQSEWFLPLRTLVTGIAAENVKEDEMGMDIACGLNPVELVLYRCIELVEEHLKQFV